MIILIRLQNARQLADSPDQTFDRIGFSDMQD